MKAIMLFFLLIVIQLSIAIEFSGQILTNKDWIRSESPYILTGEVQVGQGANLTIEAGVTIQGGSINIFDGGLRAYGSCRWPVTFNSVDVNVGTSSFEESYFVFSHVDYRGGKFFESGNAGRPKDIKIADSHFHSFESLEFLQPFHVYDAALSVQRSVFSGITGFYLATGQNVTIIDNLFDDVHPMYDLPGITKISLFQLVGNAGSNRYNFTGNNFMNLPEGVAAMELLFEGRARVNASGNYWGTADKAAVEALIIDGSDDLAFANTISFEPFLTQPSMTAPADPNAVTAPGGNGEGTPVSGIISSSTTWTKASSPYRLDGDVQLGNGATLVIESGAVIEGGSLTVFDGILSVNGECEEVTFEGVNFSCGGECNVTLDGLHMVGGYFFKPGGGNGQYPLRLVVKNSIFRDLEEFIYLAYVVTGVSFTGNVFHNCARIEIGTDTTCEFNDNLFSKMFIGFAPNEDAGIITVWATYEESMIQLHHNSFIDCAPAPVSLVAFTSDGRSINATNNYWDGAITESAIADRIKDSNDDLSLMGEIQFVPFLSEPSRTAPPLPDFNEPSASDSIPASTTGAITDVNSEVNQTGARGAASGADSSAVKEDEDDIDSSAIALMSSSISLVITLLGLM